VKIISLIFVASLMLHEITKSIFFFRNSPKYYYSLTNWWFNNCWLSSTSFNLFLILIFLYLMWTPPGLWFIKINSFNNSYHTPILFYTILQSEKLFCKSLKRFFCTIADLIIIFITVYETPFELKNISAKRLFC